MGFGKASQYTGRAVLYDRFRLFLRRTTTYVILVLVAIITIVPFWIMLSVSFTQSAAFIRFPDCLLPRPFTLANFDMLFSKTMVLRWLYNSTLVTVIAGLGAILTSAAAGYAFARGDFLGRDLLFALFLIILMVPMEARIVPMFILVSRLNLVNTYAGLIGPSFASIFGTFMLRQQYLGIPRDYDDAAMIDGASKFRIFYSVLLPQLKPALATLAVLRFMGVWNMFLYPLVIITKAELRTLTVGLTTLQLSGTQMVGVAGFQMAGAVMGFLPTFIVFLVGQRYLVQGVSMSGIKG